MSLNDSQHLAGTNDEDLGPRAAAESPVAAADVDAQAPEAPKPERKRTNWWAEIRAIIFLVMAVLAFHSLVAKPFYIPSESMMPGLLKGDRLVVSKYPYGWSWVSPSFHVLPHWNGRLFGSMPEPGDVVIVTPPGETSDYIKRAIALSGDTVAVVDGQLIINGRAVPRVRQPDLLLPMDPNIECFGQEERGADGKSYCRLHIYRETLPNGRTYDTIDSGDVPADMNGLTPDRYGPITVPDGHVFLMGDNRDHSADSRFPADDHYQGLGGPVPWENIGGRAEFITFSLDGTSEYWNPISWFTALRGGRAGTSLHPDRMQPAQ